MCDNERHGVQGAGYVIGVDTLNPAVPTGRRSGVVWCGVVCWGDSVTLRTLRSLRTTVLCGHVDNDTLWTNVPVRDSEDSEDSHGHEMRRGIAHVRHHFHYRLLFFVRRRAVSLAAWTS